MSDAPPPDPAGMTRGASAAVPTKVAQHLGMVISDRYRLVELIATGGMGAVYKAEHLLLRKWVAVKLLHPTTKNLPDQVLRFEREAIAGAHLQHPNIASATDFGRLPDGSYFLVLEYVRGIPLEDIITSGAIPATRAVKIVRQIAAALAAAHERGVIHRDIKPHNIMLDPAQGDQVKVIDFGLAKVPLERFETTAGETPSEASSSSGSGGGGRGVHRAITQRDMVFGTVAYMAPEAAGGMDKVDERSDLYALGIIMYELLAGKHPFDATDRIDLFRKQCTAQPPPFKVRSPDVDVPGDLEAMVMRLLQKDPAQRFESARELHDALNDEVPPSNKRSSSGPLVVPMMEQSSGKASSTDAARKGRQESEKTSASAAKSPPAQAAKQGAAKQGAAKQGAGKQGAGKQAAAKPRPPPSALLLGAQPPSIPPPPEPTLFAASKPDKKPRPLWLIGVVVAIAAGGAVAFQVLRSSQPAADSAGASSAATPPGSVVLAVGSSLDRERLLSSVKYKEWSSGEEALIRLVQSDPAAFHDAEVKKAAAEIADKVAPRADTRSQQIFQGLESKLGVDGLDILYDLLSAHGGTKSAELANESLRRPEVRGRVSPALKIALELREAPCDKKPDLFKRAAKEGDERAAVVLEQLQSPQCKSQNGQCCIRNDPALAQAIKTLRAPRSGP